MDSTTSAPLMSSIPQENMWQKIVSSFKEFPSFITNAQKYSTLDSIKKTYFHMNIATIVIVIIIIILLSVTLSGFSATSSDGQFSWDKLLNGEDSYQVDIVFDAKNSSVADAMKKDIDEMIKEDSRTDITVNLVPVNINNTDEATSILMKYSLLPADLPAIFINGSKFLGLKNKYSYKLRMRRRQNKTSSFSAQRVLYKRRVPRIPKPVSKSNFNAINPASKCFKCLQEGRSNCDC